MKKFVFSALMFGMLLSGCSSIFESDEESTEKEAEVKAKSEIKVEDWAAEAAKPDGPTKDVLTKAALPPAGFYKSLDVPVPTPVSEGGVVRCTFDGSEPTAATAVMTAPMTLEKSTVVRCNEYLLDSLVASATETYFIGETVNMPVVAVSVPPWYYTDILKGEPCKPDPCKDAKFWLDTSVTAHVEYFANGSASVGKAFEIDAEVAIMGGYSRNQIKKSISVKMKKGIQKGHFRYPLFETRPDHKKFKSFILRNNGNRFVSDYIEDAMATSLLEGTQVDYQRSRQVVVFYNGHYYGIHDLREKLNEHFVETNYGIDADKVDFVKHSGVTAEASGGTTDAYLNLLNMLFSNDLSTENNDTYKKFLDQVNIASWVEYFAAEIYYHNGDWPGNNVRMWRSGTQKWKIAAYDIDHGFDWMWGVEDFEQETNMFEWIRRGGHGTCMGKVDPLCFHNAFVKLNTNPDFRRTLVNRAGIMYSSYINAEKVKAATERIVATIPESESERDMERFDRSELYYQNSCGKGFSVTGSCIKQWADERDATVREEFRAEYGLGADVTVGFSSVGNGEVLLDGIALPSRTYTGVFFGGNPMVLTASGEGKFLGWEDGSTDNPRIVLPVTGAVYTATFENVIE